MKALAVFLSIAIGAASLSAHAAPASISPSTTPSNIRNAPEPDAKALKASVSHSATSPATAPRNRVFPVNDEKGLLLTCIAPELVTNPNTDLFEDCTLAPGRTLNEVMHSFVGAMHAEQKVHDQERLDWEKAFDAKSSQSAASK
jgi:hypothetical protein